MEKLAIEFYIERNNHFEKNTQVLLQHIMSSYNLSFNSLYLDMKEREVIFDKDNIMQILKDEEHVTIKDTQSNVTFLINRMLEDDFFTFTLPYGLIHQVNARSLLKKIPEFYSNTITGASHDLEHLMILSSNIYQPYRDVEEFYGFSWLNYFSPEKMQQLGGKALFDLPYATKIEEINNGILIQIGESPEEAMTPEGEEQLFKATEWVHQLIQSQGN